MAVDQRIFQGVPKIYLTTSQLSPSKKIPGFFQYISQSSRALPKLICELEMYWKIFRDYNCKMENISLIFQVFQDVREHCKFISLQNSMKCWGAHRQILLTKGGHND